ncbi:MAG: NAD(P)-dependent oxidoreductase [Actinobacteria bacterium]|nr:NAD(P)-dependent oxidoreductase [Actinomycetota bacterium]NDG11045.1 NAD(P)-dependent oxidoreductase [Actinomycetota bacterium]
MKVAFVGLGVMGGPMARHLATKGHEVTVYNRTAAKAAAWVAANGGKSAATPRDAATGADMAMVCVGNDDDVRSVIYGNDGVLASIKKGGVVVDHTTASATLARELAVKCAEQGVGFIDAPVSGGQAGAENGQLSVMCGADDEAVFERAYPVLMSYAKICKRLGNAGSGQLAKMVNQICIAGIAQGLSEGLNLALAAGLDPDALVEVISQGAAGSWQMNNRAKTMVRNEFNFGFAVEWMRKDLAICLEEAQRLGVDLPITKIVNDFYGEVVEMGGRRWDTSSLIARLRAPGDRPRG